MELTRRLFRAGVPIVAGSDFGGREVLPGFSLHDEIALLEKAGLPPLAALRSASLEVARLVGNLDAGAVEPGRVADLVLIDADPTATPRNLDRISAVFLKGRYLDRARLDGLLAAAAAENDRKPRALDR
jgi:imidazolonepropionase-like amidohydrolase